MLRDGWSTEWKLLKPSHSFLLLLLLLLKRPSQSNSSSTRSAYRIVMYESRAEALLLLKLARGSLRIVLD
jgi:hypothetical protein